jgi:AraC family transcriptional regulator, transcriptional activator of pobA
MASDIKKYRFKEGLPLEIEIIPIAKTFSLHSADMTIPHRTNFYHIVWIQKGNPIHIVDFKPIKIPSNSLLFINKERVHSFDKSGKYDGKGILFTDDFFCKTEQDTKYLKSTILFNDLLDMPVIKLDRNNNHLAEILSQMNDELGKPKDSFHYDILQNLLHNFLLLAERERRKQGFTEIKKGADLDYTILYKGLLDEHYRKIKSVSSYAGLINVSEKRLTKATTNTIGKTPKELIDDKVLLEAKRLLVHTSMTIKEIGFQLGFDEATNFIKYFRKHINKTPIEFRESYL